jgi:hypothetical protein
MRVCPRLTGKHDCFDGSLKFVASRHDTDISVKEDDDCTRPSTKRFTAVVLDRRQVPKRLPSSCT